MASIFDKLPRSAKGVSGVFPRDTPHYPSKLPERDCTQVQPKGQYSGTYVRGVILLHKQAYTPVTVDEDPKNASKMRRG